MKSIRTIVATWLLASAFPALAAEWTFGVFLNGKRIGEHRFTLRQEPDGHAEHVTSEARFDVKVLGIPVFRYAHTAEEVWRDECLVDLKTHTRVNGKEYAVSGRSHHGAFEIDVVADGQRQTSQLPACVATYAYWDVDRLRRHGELLNGQTGAYQTVARSLEPKADGDNDVISLAGDGFRIDLSYRNDDGFWTGLRTTTRDGRTLTYRLEAAGSTEL